jgi:6-phosphogluconolactonase
LNMADHGFAVVFLVGGPAKAAIVKEVLEGPIDTARLPAQLIQPKNGTLHWYLDDDSAALLAAR